MLEKEFQYYLSHQAALVEKYNEKFVVIKNDELIGVYDSEEQAYFETIMHHEVGSFLIQLCEAGDKSYTQSYHSRVSFE